MDAVFEVRIIFGCLVQEFYPVNKDSLEFSKQEELELEKLLVEWSSVLPSGNFGMGRKNTFYIE